MVTKVCVLRSGGDFNESHVIALSKQVKDLVCISDVEIDGVKTIPMTHDWPSWWSKMEAFGPSIKGDILLIDLDTIILNDIEVPSETTVLDDFYMPTLIGSGFMYVTEDDRRKVWREWMSGPIGHMNRCVTRRCHGDQGFLYPFFKNKERWGNNIVSWKKHCKNRIPTGTDVICFHGKPRPWEVEQFSYLYK